MKQLSLNIPAAFLNLDNLSFLFLFTIALAQTERHTERSLPSTLPNIGKSSPPRDAAGTPPLHHLDSPPSPNPCPVAE